MSILSNIFHKIFPASHPTVAETNKTSAPPPSSTTAIPADNPSTNTPTANVQNTTTQSIPEVDVEQVLNNKAQTAGQTLNWRSSIVDLLKLLDLDSSLQSRKDLASELGYKGDTNDSASMNIWLHRQVMNKLAANGGKVPADLKD